MTEIQGHTYQEGAIELSGEVERPSYASALDWLQRAESKAIAYDIWARGNYTRRLIHQRRSGISPLLVPFHFVDELRWAYRRLALLGFPMEFLYCGDLGPVRKVLTLHPAGNYLIDAGWGYIAALGQTTRMRGRDWFMVQGFTRPLPEAALDWLVEEAPQAFERGEVFVSAADLVGIPPADLENGSELLAEVEEAVLVKNSLRTLDVLATLELPHLDNLSAANFERFLSEHADDLLRFRQAMRKLVRTEAGVADALDEIAAELADLRLSDAHQRVRKAITKFGGTLTTVSAAVGAAASTMTQSPAIAAAAAGAAGGAAAASAALVELWKQAAEQRAKAAERRLSLLWKLGAQPPKRARAPTPDLTFRRYERTLPFVPEDSHDCHWLCPPTNGMRFLAVRRRPPAADA
jgi:hypothetical protein